MRAKRSWLRRTVGIAELLIGAYFFLLPAVRIALDLSDPGLRSAAIPRVAWRLHAALTPRFERWAKQRVAKAAGERVPHLDVSGTEWPMFGTVFYLAATESLQDAHDPAAGPPPKEYAAGAIRAAADLIVDPANAAWVKAHWGERYLTHQNVFYRMLLIMGLTGAQRLGASIDEKLLREQVESLADEIDRSPSGFLDDYPGESYPSDVLWAVTAIKGADRVLGTDHGGFVRRFLEKCTTREANGRLGLLPYQIDAPLGRAYDDSRGCSNSGILVQAPRLSPELARLWYERYEEHFWQERALAAGFTEFPRSAGIDTYADVDAGPVVFGYGLAASAFGLGAARANGRFDHAFPLSGLALIFSWPLPDGTLLLPRLFSDATDAPYLGEAGVLYNLTRLPEPGVKVVGGGVIPPLVYVFLALYFVTGALFLRAGFVRLFR